MFKCIHLCFSTAILKVPLQEFFRQLLHYVLETMHQNMFEDDFTGHREAGITASSQKERQQKLIIFISCIHTEISQKTAEIKYRETISPITEIHSPLYHLCAFQQSHYVQ